MRFLHAWRRGPLLIVLLLLAALVPMASSHVRHAAAATPIISANPPSVQPGASETISGSGFAPGHITIAGLPQGVQGGNSQSADNAGNFTFTFIVPVATPTGAYGILVQDNFGGTAQTSFTVGSTVAGAVLSLNPPSVQPGGQTILTGTGFSSQATVHFTAFGQTGTATTTNAGAFVQQLFVPQSLTPGSYTISATDGFHTAQAVLGVGVSATVATITLSPSTATPGSSVTVTGTNFTGNQIATVYSAALGIAPISVGETPSGTFSTTFTVPQGATLGQITINASDLNRNAFATLTVSNLTSTQGVTLVNAPSNASPNQLIGITGAGYTANSTVTITGLGPTVTTTASPTGTISTTITVPATQPAGSVTLTATDSVNRFATTVERISVAGISLVISPTSGAAGSTVTIAGAGFSNGEVVTVGLAQPGTLPTFIAGTTVTYTADANGNFNGTYTVPSSQPAGNYLLLAQGNTSRVQALAAYVITAAAPTATPTASGTPGVVPFPTPRPTATQVTGPLGTVPTTATTTYFAEGFTATAATSKRATFTEKLYLYNASAVSSAVTTTYYVYDTSNNTHTLVTKTDTVAPGATVVRSVNADAGNDREVSIVVSAPTGISAETVISRVATDGTTLDTGSSKGSNTLGQTWYLAEGYSGATLQEYLTLFNPGSSTATAQVQYLPSGDTPPPAAQSVTIPAQGRVTINVRSQYNALIKKGSRNIAISVTADHPIAVDRSLYWGNGGGSGKYGYSLGSAIAAGATQQFFSYLPTENGSQSFVTVLNPSGTPATVALSLRDASGSQITSASAVIAAGRRYTFVLPSIIPGNFGQVSGALSSTIPVVAEAGLYFGGGPNVGQHPGLVVQGSTGAQVGTRPNVNAGGAQLRILNTASTTIRVQVSTAGAGSTVVVFDGALPFRSAKLLNLPAGTDPRSVLVLGSGAFTATVVNGGDGAFTAWGGNLN